MASWRLGRALVVGLMLVLLAVPIVWFDPVIAGALVAVIAVAVLFNWYHAGTDTDADGDVWAAIPDWQYEGRHVESGGLSRADQEEAIEEVADRADERVPHDR